MQKFVLFSLILALVFCFSTNKNTEYNYFFDTSSKSFVIPLLEKHYVPQGVTHFNDWIIISYYSNDNNPSILAVLDKNNGNFIKYANIYFSNGNPYKGHAGGVTVSKNYIWISSDYNLYKIRIQDVINAESGSNVYIIETFGIPVKGAFIQYYNNSIWVGEFYHSYDYLTKPSHKLINRKNNEYNAWVTEFALDENENINNIKRILSIPDIVQDIEFADNYIILSRSYGRKNNSIIEFYPNDLNENPHSHVKYLDRNIPVWYLDNPEIKLNILPMSEGITKIDSSLYILFESAALKYINGGKYPTKYIWKLNLKKLETK
ncbi:MAG: hypothetical protein B6I29_00025 [Marinitoga sp. 4572_148]|nr:MAG: hypothetical protein B6I29_00025 [Marinitoga sp. 4572_148]